MNKMTEFYITLARKINKISEFYMIFAVKVPEFYVKLAEKCFARFFGRGGQYVGYLPPPCLPSPTLLNLYKSCIQFSAMVT